jgi:arginyl-tRNA synthetase
MSELVRHQEVRYREVVGLRDSVLARRAQLPVPALGQYPLSRLRDRLDQVLRAHADGRDVTFEIDVLDRSKFGADFAVRVTGLLGRSGAKDYIAVHVPWIAEALAGAELTDAVAEVATKGIYVNLRMRDRWFLEGVQSIIDLGDLYGQNDTHSDRVQLVDYSSPNVAKMLHAGHFRSTILGHVLSNLYEACGAIVYRVNHINDFGGFGFLLEGLRRFEPYFPDSLEGNERLLETYAIRRALERAMASGLEGADEQDRETLARYFPEVTSTEALRQASAEFVAAADERFLKLEEGEYDEVTRWREMVEWSLNSFRSFYTALGIGIDFLIGESFYARAGNAVVDRAIEEGRAFELTREQVDEQVATLDREVAAGEITPDARATAVAQLEKDIGAVVVALSGGERLVVRRSDGRSIYATRDLGAIELRREIFDPTDMEYVVGQEQRVHFARLFEAARVLGIATETEPRFKHIYFGFYVDAKTGRKLSSRESVSGVNELLAGAVEHFRAKSAEDEALTGEELDEAAQQLAVGSVIFNDLKRDMKSPIPMAAGDPGPMIVEFERSGGPYVVYAACRARAILRRYGKSLPHLSQAGDPELSDREAQLISRMFALPDVVIRAADEDNPTILVQHLLDTASAYNSYYTSAPVLKGGQATNYRLMITRAVQLVLTNGLRFCHVECPAKI